MVFSEQRALQLGADEVGRRGKAIYENTLRAQLDTPANLGQFLAIDIDTGEYALGDRMEVTRTLRQRHPEAVMYLMKIGYPAAVTMAGSMRPLSR